MFYFLTVWIKKCKNTIYVYEYTMKTCIESLFVEAIFKKKSRISTCLSITIKLYTKMQKVFNSNDNIFFL